MAVKVIIVYYSMHGHVERLAKEVEKGANSVEGVQAKLWQVPETLSNEELAKQSAPHKSDVPMITPNELSKADGFVFGFPTRFEMMAAQFKAFLDATGDLWKTQQLAGKPAGIFTSTSSQGGGQETTAYCNHSAGSSWNDIPFVPLGMGYAYSPGMLKKLKVHVKGGSPYGAGTFDGREPNWLELEHAFHQGNYITAITKKLEEAAA